LFVWSATDRVVTRKIVILAHRPAKLFFEVGPDWIEANPSFSSDMQAARILVGAFV